MNRSGLQRLIPIILVIIVVVVAVTALVSLGRTMFSGGGDNASPDATPTVNSGKKALTTTSGDYGVEMLWRGPITANETFRSYRIAVSPTERTMTTYTGYMGKEIASEKLDNNTEAYTQFVYALDRAKLMDGQKLSGAENDLRGICANGNVFQFATMQRSNVVQKYWTTTCKGSQGSLAANVTQVSRLFQRQIPTYTKLYQKMMQTP